MAFVSFGLVLVQVYVHGKLLTQKSHRPAIAASYNKINPKESIKPMTFVSCGLVLA
jgi:hypothetical protein